jgi:hypothetical protein
VSPWSNSGRRQDVRGRLSELAQIWHDFDAFRQRLSIGSSSVFKRLQDTLQKHCRD